MDAPSVSAYTHMQLLPAGYRLQEVLAFHQRDQQQVAEKVSYQCGGAVCLYKALDWGGLPAWMDMTWLPVRAGAPAGAWQVQARLQVLSDAERSFPVAQQDSVPQEALWAATVHRMLGLTHPPHPLEAAHRLHPVLGPLLQRQQGLHVPAAPTVWEALTWAITGQQISVAAAVALRRRLVQAAGTPLQAFHAMEAPALTTYPSAAQVLQLGTAGLRDAGYSQSKARALLMLAEAVAHGALPLAQWQQANDAGQLDAEAVESITRQLLAVPGIGPWTVHYTLLRGLGWPDGSLHGDVAVRKALAQLLQVERVSESEARQWLAAFAPWRALVAAHLWASLSKQAY